MWPQKEHECVLWLFFLALCVRSEACVCLLWNLIVWKASLMHDSSSLFWLSSQLVSTHRHTGHHTVDLNTPHTVCFTGTLRNVSSLTHHPYLMPVLMLVIIDNVISVLCCYTVSSPAISHANLSSPYHLSTYSTTHPSLSSSICKAMIVHYSTCISYHVKANSFLSAWPPRSLSYSLCITSRAQTIFKQAMRGPVILFHVVPAAMKRQYELLMVQNELSPPQSNRVRFSQDSQQSGDRSSLVGGLTSRSGLPPGLNHK